MPSAYHTNLWGQCCDLGLFNLARSTDYLNIMNVQVFHQRIFPSMMARAYFKMSVVGQWFREHDISFYQMDWPPQSPGHWESLGCAGEDFTQQPDSLIIITGSLLRSLFQISLCRGRIHSMGHSDYKLFNHILLFTNLVSQKGEHARPTRNGPSHPALSLLT